MAMENKEIEQLLEVISQGGFDRIAVKLRISWGTYECEGYLKKLIVDERGDREGFPPEVFRAIIKLSNGHPTFIESNDVWGSHELRHKFREEQKWTSNRVVDTPRQRFPISPLTLSILMVLAWLLWKVYSNL